MRFDHPFTLAELAALTGSEAVGDPSAKILGINEMNRVSAGDLSFCDHPKYYKKALHSAASALLIDRLPDDSNGKLLLIHPAPFAAFTALTERFRAFVAQQQGIDPSARIGAGTAVMPGVVIGRNAVIGRDCLLHPNVVIGDGTVIGDRVIIHAGTVIGTDAFYYKKSNGYHKLHSCGRVEIGDDVEIGAACTIDRGVTSATIIGSGTKMDNMVHIGHDTVIGRNCLFAAQVGIAGAVTVEDEVVLWGQVGVQKGLTLGKGAIVLGQSGVGKDLKPGHTYFGSPVREAREKMRELALIKQLPGLLLPLSPLPAVDE